VLNLQRGIENVNKNRWNNFKFNPASSKQKKN